MNDANQSFLAEQKQAQELFNIDATDHQITSVLRKRIHDSEEFYRGNDAYKIEDTRKKNQQMLFGDHYKAGKYPALRDASVKYQEPQIYAAIQTIISYATSRIHEVEARPWNDSVAGRMVSRDFAKYAEAHGVEHDLRGKTERMLYDLMQKRVGAMKLVYDTTYKGVGEICPKHIDPARLIFDHTAGLDDNPGFIAEKIPCTAQELIQKFPEKREEILELIGAKVGTQKQLATRMDYFEVWLTGADKKGNPEEQLVIFTGGVVLAKTRNPHWLYDVEAELISNHLPLPPKPYLMLNLLNDGSNKLDQTSLIELVATLQHALNRRKRTIAEAAERVGGLNVFSASAVDKEDVEDLTYDGDESIVVDSDDVRTAVTKISPNFLPQWIMNDAIDIRNTIHSIIGTPPNLRGDNSDAETLGEAIMQRNQAEGRLEPLMRALDNFFNKYFNLFFHLMRVHYTKEHWQVIAGDDGTFDYVMMSRDRVKDGMDVYVKAGTNQPQDEQFLASVAVRLANMDRIDNLSLYEMLKLPHAERMVERLIKERVDPTLLDKDIKQDQGDRTAYMDYEVIMAGEYAPPRKDPEVGHIETHREQMLSDEYVNGTDETGTVVWTPEKKAAFVAHVEAEIASLQRRAEAMQNNLVNQQNAELAVPGGQPQPPEMPVGMPGAPAPIEAPAITPPIPAAPSPVAPPAPMM